MERGTATARLSPTVTAAPPSSRMRDVPRGFFKSAVYRDDAGRLHERSAACPHLGCIVSWNSTERSWDCPCHGSRFDPNGKVLNGPAIGPLEPAKAS